MIDDDDDDDLPTDPATRLAEARRRAVYWLPNMFTLAGLFAGFYSIIAASHDRFAVAAVAIGVAMLFDGTDGRIARLTHTTSDFGKELDSLCDAVSFGVAPAFVVYQWGFERIADYGWLWSRFGWACAFVYLASTALRLARFNVRINVQDKGWFQGLPSPAAAGLVASAVWCGTEYGPRFELYGSDLSIPAFIVTMLAGICMVSNFPYWSGKTVNPQGAVKLRNFALGVFIAIVISVEPPLWFFVLFASYAASGPATSFWRWRKRNYGRAPA